MPCAAFSGSLIAAYPEAKVTLTTRDLDAWYKSMMGTIIAARRSIPIKLLSYIDPDHLGPLKPMNESLLDAYFEHKPFEESGKRKFVEHYNEVREHVPRENLLEYRVGEGWDRLCEFLNQPVPESQFPRTNDTNAFGDLMGVVMKQAMLRFLKRAAPGIGALGAGGAALYYFKGCL